MQRQLEMEKSTENESVKCQDSFALSEVGSLYFGPNPSTEARRLIEQAKELIRENTRIQEAKAMILQEEAELYNRKVYFNSENSPNDVFQADAELHRLLSRTIALSDKGKKIDDCKAQLELYYKELKRRKEFLQEAIKMHEESQYSQGYVETANPGSGATSCLQAIWKLPISVLPG